MTIHTLIIKKKKKYSRWSAIKHASSVGQSHHVGLSIGATVTVASEASSSRRGVYSTCKEVTARVNSVT